MSHLLLHNTLLWLKIISSTAALVLQLRLDTSTIMEDLPGDGALIKVEDISDDIASIKLQDTSNNGPSVEEHHTLHTAQDISDDGPPAENPDTLRKVESTSVDDVSTKPQATSNAGHSVAEEHNPGVGTTVKGKATPSDGPGEICLIEYLFKRLHQLGVRSIYGVPGDYNLMDSTMFSPVVCDG